MSQHFTFWLEAQLRERGWSQSEAARRGGFSASMIQQVLSGTTNPGLDFCRGISRAFKLPLEDVFRFAGILPPARPYLRLRERRMTYQINTEDTERRFMELWRGLSLDDQELVLDLIERLVGAAPRIVGEETGD